MVRCDEPYTLPSNEMLILVTAFDYRLFQRAEYLLLCAYGWFSILAYVVLIFSLANYANYIGLSASDAAIVSAILNLGQGLGRPPIGYFSDSIGRLNMAASEY